VLQNGTQGLLLTLAAFKERGVARVAVAAPCYFAAIQACRLLSLSVEVIPAADYLTGAPDIAAVAAAVRAPRTALLLTNPAYSLGVEYGWETLARLLDAIPFHVPVLLDETRLGLSWRSDAPWYAADYPPNVAVLRSPSKIWFVNGAKTSFLLAAPALAREVDRLAEGLVGSMAAHAEPLALAYLDALADWLDEVAHGEAGPMLAWRRRVVAALRGTADVLPPPLAAAGFALSPVDSGPYAFAAAHHPLADLPCVELARQNGLLVMDAHYFCHTQPRRGGFRINLCLPAEQARSGLRRLASMLH
jgi:aspartate/methionine/tyrosine aminotransferase